MLITVSHRGGPENEVYHESEWSTYEERKAKHRVRRSVQRYLSFEIFSTAGALVVITV